MKFLFRFNGAEQTENVAVSAEESLTEQELANVTGGCGSSCGDRGDNGHGNCGNHGYGGDGGCGDNGNRGGHHHHHSSRHGGCDY